jgi:carbonic anhydrase/acetyltransferase-like protein (isoleucine patch superfamily)
MPSLAEVWVLTVFIATVAVAEGAVVAVGSSVAVGAVVAEGAVVGTEVSVARGGFVAGGTTTVAGRVGRVDEHAEITRTPTNTITTIFITIE